MSKASRERKKTEQWKTKAVDRGLKQRYSEKEKNRIRNERDQYKRKYRDLKKTLQKERKKNIQLCINNKVDLVYVSLQLFLVVGIGFRAISRVLGLLSPYLGLKKAPCPQTIINWVNRLSIARIHDASRLTSKYITPGDPFSNGFMWMIDVSIGLGSGKILTVLALDAHHHKLNNKGAPKQENVHCIAVAVKNSWTGETIADLLQKIIGVLGRPTSFLKDGGTDLKKAVELLDERGMPSQAIDDVSHKIANILKHEYGKIEVFNQFISECGKVSKRLKQTLLACLAPPKVSHKARFMNVHILVRWADKLLKHSKPGRAAQNSMLFKLRASLEGLPDCKKIIQRFLRDAVPLLECQKLLKNQGLTQQVYDDSKKIIEAIPSQSAVRKEFMGWLDTHFEIAQTLGLESAGLPCSTDAIESLFGLGKVRGTGEVKDAKRIAGRLPSLAGHFTKEDGQRVLDISVQEQKEIMEETDSITKQRRDVLPNPGKLESLKNISTTGDFMLIPRSINWEKNEKNHLFKGNLENSYGPQENCININRPALNNRFFSANPPR